MTIDWVGRTGQSRGTEWHHIDTLTTIRKTLVITTKHLVPGQQVVTKGNRLCRLQVSEARHDCVSIALSQIQKTRLQTRDFRQYLVNLITHVEADIGRYLVVTRTSGMQLFTGNANLLSQCRFNVHVHIFQCNRPFELTTFNLNANLTQTFNDCIALIFSQNTHFGQHACMRNRALNVLAIETLIKINRGCESSHKRIGCLTKTTTPLLVRLITHLIYLS